MVDNWKSGILWSCIYSKTTSLEVSRYCQTSVFSPISTLANPVFVKRLLFSSAIFMEPPHTSNLIPFLRKILRRWQCLYLFDASHTTGEQPALVSTTATCPRSFSIGDLNNCYCPHHFRANFHLNVTVYIASPATCWVVFFGWNWETVGHWNE